ncbi:MAG: TM0106 family RecB-like putative nuclease [Vicinamibacterales bacterium]
MYASASKLILSPSDLSAFLGCRHRAGLDLAVARGALTAPERDDAFAQALRDRGLEHEQRYLAWLRAQGRTVVDLSAARGDAAVRATREAMAAGTDVVYQAALAGDGWRGYADVLVRVERPSALGAWSYEAHDTKLARETKGGTILQLSAYSDLLTALQGAAPEHFHVVTPAPVEGPVATSVMAPPPAGPTPAGASAPAGQGALPFPGDGPDAGADRATSFAVETYRVGDYAAYYRRVKAQLLDTLGRGHEAVLAATYPEPVEACELCRWWGRCNGRRRRDDHLTFVAGMSRAHAAEFTAHGAPTLAAAAALPLPLAFAPTRGSRETFERLVDQARLQQEQRTSGTPVHELLPVEPPLGLCRLPAPSPGDLFLDLEGAAFARDGGREYLFGLWSAEGDERWWALDDAAERAAFEALMDRVERQWAAHPDMHVYHFAPYEPSALKRLMGRYATRADLLDRLLRGERLVDLLAVVRQALRAGVESYSIKQLEPFYGFVRDVALAEARPHLVAMELALESRAPQAVAEATRAAVAGYNRDDCRSTMALRDWLEGLRASLEAAGTVVPRPDDKASEPPKDVGALEARQHQARERLLEGLAAEAATPGHPDHPRWLLAYLLDWHRREEKVAWWEHFRLAGLAADDLLDESAGVGGLEFVERVDVVFRKGTQTPTGSVVDRYRYVLQETEVGRGAVKRPGGDTFGEVVACDRQARTLDIRKGKTTADVHPRAVFQSDVFGTGVQQESLLRLSEAAPGGASSGMDLLHRRPPRLTSGALDALPGEPLVDRARRLALSLDRTTLAVQGPPGAGKTYLGAQMIRALVAAGKRVGVVAPSHAVIVNLLDAVAAQASDAHETVRLGRKLGTGEEEDEGTAPAIAGLRGNDDALAAIAGRTVDVLGGTAWLWARPEFTGAVDVLVVDEAGQFSLANALAVSLAAESLVLLGDPQQLNQPQKGSHPDGVDVSALQHVLGKDVQTMPADRGLFLPHTWRMAPAVCGFTSEVFYQGRLDTAEGRERQVLTGTDGFDGAGPWWLPVVHDANRNWSAEEIDAVATLLDRLVTPGARWIDHEGRAHPLTAGDILVVAPYNAHVNRLADRLGPRGVSVGTVDRFQGQEAPVVVYAMAASTPADAPRGMEFLYSRHRLNVATSRARCAAFVVASPALLEPECRTPRQMALANALCRFVEMARRSGRHASAADKREGP